MQIMEEQDPQQIAQQPAGSAIVANPNQKEQIVETLNKNCKEIVRNINMNNAYFNIFMLLVLFIEVASISYKYVLLFLWIFDIQELYNQAKFHRFVQSMDSSFDQYKADLKRSIKLEIFDCIIGFSFKLSILLYFENETESLAYPSIVAFVYFAIRIITQIICRGKKSSNIESDNNDVSENLQILQAEKQKNSFYFIINNWVFRIYFIAQTIFFSLKHEQFIDWNWSEVFWVYWVFFCIIIGITLIIFLLLVVKVCDLCGGSKNEVIEIQGLFWFFMIMGFITANSSYTILLYTEVLTAIDDSKNTVGKNTYEINQLEQNLTNAQQDLIPIIYLVAGGFIGQLIYYIALNKQISSFVNLIMFSYGDEEEKQDEEAENNQRNNQQQNQHLQRDSARNNAPKKVRMAYKSKLVLEEKEVAPTMDLPQFVSKISSTYFRFLMNKKEVQTEIIQKKQNSKQKKQKESSKQIPNQPKIPQINNNNGGNSTKSKKSIGRFSIRSMNRSATAITTMQTQGTVNTQADMLQSSRLNTQEKQYTEQNDFEDVFKDGSSGSQDKQDLRGQNFIKKNFKALNKQKFPDIPNFISPKNMNCQKINIPMMNSNEKIDCDEIQEDSCKNKHSNILSPVGGFDCPINQRRQISLANPFIQQQQNQNGRQNALNMTAPYITNPSQIFEEDEEHESHFYEKNHKGQHHMFTNESQNHDDIIHFDDESQDQNMDTHNNNNNQNGDEGTKRDELSQMTSSVQQSVSTCLVCFDATPDSIFNPCGHGGLCYECAIDLMKKTGECYLCRTKIEEILKIDIESKNLGIMKIITTTKLVKVREKIQITEQEYQYYSALRRNRRLQQQNLGSGQNQNQQNNNNNNNNSNGGQANPQQQQQQLQEDQVINQNLENLNHDNIMNNILENDNNNNNQNNPLSDNIFSNNAVDDHQINIQIQQNQALLVNQNNQSQ